MFPFQLFPLGAKEGRREWAGRSTLYMGKVSPCMLKRYLFNISVYSLFYTAGLLLTIRQL